MLFKLNLQLFSEGDKTEKPSPKKRSDAREEGQIVQSKEINTVVILFVCFLALKFLGGFLVLEFEKLFEGIFSNLDKTDIFLHEDNIRRNFLNIVKIIGITSLPILMVSFLGALVVNYAQVGFLFTTKPLKWKLDRLDPIQGFKRLFSKKAIFELLKSILKIVLVGFVAYKYVNNQMNRIISYPGYETISFLSNFANLVYKAMTNILGILLALSIMDYFFQWRSHEKNLMMTKQELKEEYKQAEGDPMIKGKIKERQRQMAMSRMMQDIKSADVIITNPTHFAVAIKYDPSKYDAPYLLGKGQDLIAQNIKEVARENEIPIVENKPLARAIYADVEINEFIPEELYELVAEVLAYVYSLKEEY